MEPIYDASRTRCQEHGERIAELKSDVRRLAQEKCDLWDRIATRDHDLLALTARVAALEAQLIAVPILGALDSSARIPPPPEAQP